MTFEQYSPGPPLGLFIERFWFYEGLSPAHRLERVFPDGTVELLINLKEEARHVFDPRNLRPRQSCRRAWISGTHSRSIVIDTAPDSSMIGAHFRPGGAAEFLGMPAAELADQVVELDALWGADGPRLRETLLDAGRPAMKFGILEAFLLARWRAGERRTRNKSVAWLPSALAQLTSDSPGNIRHLATRLGLSHKHFIECFRRQVGLTPKHFARIHRFQSVLRQIPTDAPIDWADVASGCGYYDQAHFIHEFKAFSGLSPGSYLNQRGEDSNFVPITVN